MSRSQTALLALILLVFGPTACAALPAAMLSNSTDTSATRTTEPEPARTPQTSTTESQTSTRPVTVAHVVDGDTFEGSDGITYRLAAIDAPESGDALGPAATTRLEELLDGDITVELGEKTSTDRYGRTLVYVFAGETFVNEALIREGMAEEAFYGDNDKYRQRYLDAQAAAQRAAVGIWAPPPTTSTVPPTTVPPTTVPPTTTVPAPPPPPPPPPPTIPAPAPPVQSCTPGYDPCVPPASDVDCAGGSGNGPVYVNGPVRVTGPDPYGLDADHDGLGCE